MANKRDDSQFGGSQSSHDASEQTVLERVQELTWALLDEDITDDEMSLLDTLLLTGEAARNRYVECVQMHTDLMVHYAQPSKSADDSKPPVLSFLGNGVGIDLPTSRPANS
jgi:hypothetical protein